MASVARPLSHEPATSAGSSVTPLIAPGHTYRSITEKISGVVLSGDIPTGWFVGIAFSLVLLGSLGISAVVLLVVGTGIWGINVPIGWGFAIINFVWWIGIGHAGTLISAILHLLNQQWRTSINRFAEAMTLFAVLCAGYVPPAPHRSSLACRLLAVSLSEHDGGMATVSQPADLGRVCGKYLFDGLTVVLVCRVDS